MIDLHKSNGIKENDVMSDNFELVRFSRTGETKGTGWLQPLPDLRDYTDQTPKIVEILNRINENKTGKMKVSAKRTKTAALPAKVDLRKSFPPVRDQKDLGSCSAHAGIGIVEYYQNRNNGSYIDGSRLFTYKTTRNLLGLTGDTGAYLRTTMKALVMLGVCPEKYLPYDIKRFDVEPTAFHYALADNYEATKYFCHDPASLNRSGAEVLDKVKAHLDMGIPSMFGFYGFSSFESTDTPGGIPYPSTGESMLWGHAVIAAGYDDSIKIKNTSSKKTTKGALLIRNSWGPDWGDKGYGWLPYEYVKSRYALDFWSLVSMEWTDLNPFE